MWLLTYIPNDVLGIWFVLGDLLSVGLRTRFYCFYQWSSYKRRRVCVVHSHWQDDLWLSSVCTVFSSLLFWASERHRGLDKAICLKIKPCKIQGKLIYCRKYFEEIACLVTTAYVRITGSEDKAFGLHTLFSRLSDDLLIVLGEPTHMYNSGNAKLLLIFIKLLKFIKYNKNPLELFNILLIFKAWDAAV